MALTKKQQLFVDEYLIDLNATQAAKRAGYSEKNSFKIGSELLQKTTVSEAIQRRMKDRRARTEITQDKVLLELSRIAFANGSDYAKVVEKTRIVEITDSAGKVVDEKEIKYKGVDVTETSELDPEKLHAIAGIKTTNTGIEVKLHDKLKALELIGEHLGMFAKKLNVDHSGKIDTGNPFAGLTTEELRELVKRG